VFALTTRHSGHMRLLQMRERERYIQHSFLEFWLVDHPEQGMPGAWYDYDKNSYDN